MCQMIIKHYICPVLRPRKGISELESAGDSNDCKTGGSVRLYPRIPFALIKRSCFLWFCGHTYLLFQFREIYSYHFV